MLNGLTLNKVLKVHKTLTLVQSWNIVAMNRLKRKMKEQMTKEVKMEIAMVMMMMMMMIWMTRTDEHHAPSITMIRSRYHVTCVALKHFKCEQYLTFSPSILLFFKHFGCKFKELNHIKELRTPYFKIKTSLGLIFPVLEKPVTPVSTRYQISFLWGRLLR